MLDADEAIAQCMAPKKRLKHKLRKSLNLPDDIHLERYVYTSLKDPTIMYDNFFHPLFQFKVDEQYFLRLSRWYFPAQVEMANPVQGVVDEDAKALELSAIMKHFPAPLLNSKLPVKFVICSVHSPAEHNLTNLRFPSNNTDGKIHACVTVGPFLLEFDLTGISR